MEQQHHSFFLTIETPNTLTGRVLERIQKEKQWCEIRRPLFLFAIAIGIAIGLLVPAFISLVKEISQTGFGQYISLLVTDPATALQYWKDFLSLVSESLPVMGIVLVLAPAALFLWSVDAFIRLLIKKSRFKPISYASHV